MSDYFEAVDGDNELTIWRLTDSDDRPQPMLRLCDIPSQGRHLWPLFVKAVTA